MTVPDVGTQIGKAISEAPIGDLILSIATGIARAQQSLDLALLRSAAFMAGEFEDDNGEVKDSRVKLGGEEVSLLELGFTPTFYQFVETTIEVKISLSMNATQEQSQTNFDLKAKAGVESSIGWTGVGAQMTASVSAVTATNSSKFQYQAEASSMVRTRIVPLPPPALLEERLRRIVDKRYTK